MAVGRLQVNTTDETEAIEIQSLSTPLVQYFCI